MLKHHQRSMSSMDIERSLRRLEFRLFRHPLADELFEHTAVAEKLGFDPAALADILAAGFGPEPLPACNADCYWFERWQVADFWLWLTISASDQDCSDIAGIMLRHDPALVEPDGEYVREHVLEALREARGHNNYSERFGLVLDA